MGCELGKTVWGTGNTGWRTLATLGAGARIVGVGGCTLGDCCSPLEIAAPLLEAAASLLVVALQLGGH